LSRESIVARLVDVRFEVDVCGSESRGEGDEGDGIGEGDGLGESGGDGDGLDLAYGPVLPVLLATFMKPFLDLSSL
jgi:hypothetical protein